MAILDHSIEYRGKRSYSCLHVRISISKVLKGQSIGAFFAPRESSLWERVVCGWFLHRSKELMQELPRRDMKLVIRFIGWLKMMFPGFLRCSSCYRAFSRDKLKYKRLLSRREAELLERKINLASHFVYTCPVCNGEIIDIARKKGKVSRKDARFP